MSKLKIVVCRVGAAPVVEEIDHGLKPMQAIVGGYIELVRLAGEYDGDGIDLYCDEEFLCKDYLPNRLVANTTPIHGDFFIVGHDAEGETVGLTDAQCAEWMAKANSWPAAINLPQGD